MPDAPSHLLRCTPLLDFRHPDIEHLVSDRNWRALALRERIGADLRLRAQRDRRSATTRADELPASRVLADGIGQCNTKSTLLMALLRAAGVPCRFHGFTIDKALQKRRRSTGLAYRLAPRDASSTAGSRCGSRAGG
jgi:transglutaminase-like putative cysteine protease